MFFFVPVLVALFLAVASVEAKGGERGITIPLTRRDSGLSFGQEIDLKLFVAQMHRVEQKYKKSLDNYKARTGHQNPLFRAIAELIKRDTTSIHLSIYGDGQLWTGPVTVGGQKFELDFDTGSADVIVNPGAYDPIKSSASKKTKAKFSTAYADGTSSDGYIFTDSFKLGNINAKNVAIGRSDKVFVKGEGKSEGIAGLSFQSISTFPSNKYKPFFDTLADQHAISSKKFQFSLDRFGGELHFGGIDHSKIKGGISWSDVNADHGFWATDMKVNGQNFIGIVDSGSSIISGPTDQVRKFFKSLQGIQTFTQGGSLFGAYDCFKPPKVEFEIGGKKFPLGHDVMSFGMAGGKCVLSVNGMDGIPMNAWIVGDTLFMNNVVIFDADKKRVGFAKRR